MVIQNEAPTLHTLFFYFVVNSGSGCGVSKGASGGRPLLGGAGAGLLL